LYGGFIQNYESENGISPFMPASSLSYYLRDVDYGDYAGVEESKNSVALPLFSLGDTRFKLLYGVRKLLNHDVKMEDAPGVKEILKAHNQSSDQKHNLDEKSTETLFVNNVHLLQYVIDARRYRGLLSLVSATSADANPSTTGVVDRSIASYPHVWNTRIFIDTDKSSKILLYQLAKSRVLTDVVRLTESANQKEQKRLIVATIEDSGDCPSPKDREVQVVNNIIDLNIVPINLYALRREIPLINLINYSYTFDQLMQETLNTKIDVTKDRLTSAELRGTKIGHPGKKLLTYLLSNPYIPMNEEVYRFYLPRLMRGDIGIEGLGLPKFLGEEIYNKVLFGELYSAGVYGEEGGPAFGSAHQRGKEQVVADQRLGIIASEYRKLTICIVSAFLYAYCYKKVDGFGGSIPDGGEKYIRDIAEEVIKNSIDGNYSKIFSYIKGKLYPSPPGTKYDPEVTKVTLVSVVLAHLLNFESMYHDIISILAKEKRGHPGSSLLPALTEIVRIAAQFFGSENIDASMKNGPTWEYLYKIPNNSSIKVHGKSADYIQRYMDDITIRNPPPVFAFYYTNGMGVHTRDVSNFSSYYGEMYNALGFKEYEDISFANRKKVEKQNDLYFPKTLHYLEKGKNEGTIKEVDINLGEGKMMLQIYGKLRFDTIYIRNLVWITNIQRMLRLIMRRNLFWYDSRIVSDHAVLTPGITESYGNDNYSSNSTKYDY
jgi:hypothetical protein